jgi:Sigma-70, region 4
MTRLALATVRPRERFKKLYQIGLILLSESYRVVFMLRDVAGMSTEETAACLNLTQETSKSGCIGLTPCCENNSMLPSARRLPAVSSFLQCAVTGS